MSTPLIIQLCEQIKDALNAAVSSDSFVDSFEAIRYYQPKFTLPELEQRIRVCVVPSTVARQDASRGYNQQDSEIQIGILKRVSLENQSIDPLVELVDQIALFLDGRKLTGGQIIDATIDPIFDQQLLIERKQFTSVIKLLVRSFFQ